MNNFHEENARLLFSNTEGYCPISNIPEIFKQLSKEAGKILINTITQSILNKKLSESLKMMLVNGEIIEVDIEEVYLKENEPENKSWTVLINNLKKKYPSEHYFGVWWESYFNLSKLMIHIKDIIKILKDVKLDNISKLLSSVVYKPICKRIIRKKCDEEIIKQHLEIKNKNPAYSDRKIADLILESAKKNKKEEINKLISELKVRTIEDFISDHNKLLVQEVYAKHYKWYNNSQISENTFKEILEELATGGKAEAFNQLQQKIQLRSEVENIGNDNSKINDEDKSLDPQLLANMLKVRLDLENVKNNLLALNYGKGRLRSELKKTQLKAEEAGGGNSLLNSEVEHLAKILSDINTEVDKQNELLIEIQKKVDTVKTAEKMITDCYIEKLDTKFIKETATKFQIKENSVQRILSTITANNYIYKLDLPY